jgi:tRNA A-37 threonylcarbamoyl transferase component Bud32
MVCRGEWRGQTVFVKVYLDSDRHWRHELQGLAALHAAGIPAPRILHSGTADTGAIPVILLEPVSPATSFETAWRQTRDETAHLGLLERAARTIARHHRAGLEQRDIHLDNFLLSGEQLYTIDGGGIRVSGRGELSIRRSRDNLALFLAQLFPRFDDLAAAVLDAYRSERDWEEGVLTVSELRRRVRRCRRRRVRRFLRKVFRNSTAFACERDWRYFRVYDRSMASPEMRAFLADPDASLDLPETRYLKQGNTCTLWLVRIDDRLLVVKRYNLKRLSHRIGRALRRTRAAVSWENAHRLGMYGIATARPVALLERRLGPLRGEAWFVSEYIAGDDVLRLCAEPAQDVARQVLDLLAQLSQCRISHGDMKGSNIILAEQGPQIIDLDAMREHVLNWTYRRMRSRDLRRFMRNWDDCPGIAGYFRASLFSDGLSSGC